MSKVIWHSMNNSALGDWFIYLLIIVFKVSQSFQVLLSFPKKGIWIDQKTVLRTKSVKQLKSMLKGVKGVSNLKKEQLIDRCLLLA